MNKAIPLQLLQTTAAVDRRGRALRDLRISVIDRCNFRCPYCMPEESYPRDAKFLSSAERLSGAEIERLARVFVEFGVSKLRLTGGEPLLRRDLADIVRRLSGIEGVEDLALTTNGMLLEQQAGALRQAGLQRITVSLDALDPATFARLSGGRGEVDQVLAGIDAARVAGFSSIKLNCVVMRGENQREVIGLLQRFRGSGVIVRFIEYMDVGSCNGWTVERVVSSRELIEEIHSVWPIEAVQRSYRGEVAERWRFVDGAGELGFVSSVSAPFCGDCQRARLSADGQLFTCLFAGSGHDLRGVLRSGAEDDALRERISAIWQGRTDRYSELRAERAGGATREKVEMYRIGG